MEQRPDETGQGRRRSNQGEGAVGKRDWEVAGTARTAVLPGTRMEKVRAKQISLCFYEGPSDMLLNKARYRTVCSLSPSVLKMCLYVYIFLEEKVRNQIVFLSPKVILVMIGKTLILYFSVGLFEKSICIVTF